MSIFDNIEYLKSGSSRQQEVYEVLTKNHIFEQLAEFIPLLAGTIPIGVDIKTSDLDIICYWTDRLYFIKKVEQLYGHQTDFCLRQSTVFDSVIATFKMAQFKIEIFAQNIPSKEQNAYRHMLVEHQLLLEKGDDFREKIRDLKKQGIKTEPAFAMLLGLPGDPYTALLELESRFQIR